MNNLEYYITKETCAVIAVGETSCEVIEGDRKFSVLRSCMDVINDSCVYFGSTYEGRLLASKSMLKMTYKLPIIIEEYNGIIFFPTGSPRFNSCVWLNLASIASYERNGNDSKVIFKSGAVLELQISYYSLENQIFRATMLESLIRKRKKMEE